jgi:flavin-dependent dehydrogenase
MFTPHGSGWALDRLSFEKMLAKNFVSRGGDLLTQHQVITCEALPKGGWKVLIKSAENEVRTIYAKYVIDASGRRGVMRTNLNLPLTVHDRLVGIGCVGSIAEDSYIEFTNQVEACEYGWWYITPLEDNRVSVVLMSDPDIINKMHISQLTVWRDLLANMPHSGLKMQQVFFAEQPRSFPCFSSFLPEAGGVDWVAIGDAVASYDPISSSGIPRAIASGIHGALVAIDSLQGNGGMLNLYAQTIQQDFAQYLQTQWQSYQREARWLDAPFWARRRAVIAISAESSVKATRFYDARSSFEPIHLKSNELHALWSLCSAGKNLREIITQFMRQHRHIPEQKIMLGLQELIARDYLDISAEEDEDCVFFNTERLVFD